MSVKPINVRALALNEQLNVIMEPEVDTPRNADHMAALAKHYGGYKEELPTDVDNLNVFEAKCSGHNMVNMPGDLISQLKKRDLSYNRFTYVSDMAEYPDREDVKLPYNQIADLDGNCFIDNHEIVSLALSRNKLGTLRVNDLAGFCNLVSLDLSSNKFVSISKKGLRCLSSLQPLNLVRNGLSFGKDTVVLGEVLDVLDSEYVSHAVKLKENFGDFITMVRDKFISLPFKYDSGLIGAVYDRGIDMHRYGRITAMLGKLFKFAQASTYDMINQLGVYSSLVVEQEIKMDAKLRAYEKYLKVSVYNRFMLHEVYDESVRRRLLSYMRNRDNIRESLIDTFKIISNSKVYKDVACVKLLQKVRYATDNLQAGQASPRRIKGSSNKSELVKILYPKVGALPI